MSSSETQMNPLPLDPVAVFELGHLAHDLEGRAISLYLARPESRDEIRSIVEGAALQITSLATQVLRDGYTCPMGTVKCRGGCCYVGVPGSPDSPDSPDFPR